MEKPEKKDDKVEGGGRWEGRTMRKREDKREWKAGKHIRLLCEWGLGSQFALRAHGTYNHVVTKAAKPQKC